MENQLPRLGYRGRYPPADMLHNWLSNLRELLFAGKLPEDCEPQIFAWEHEYVPDTRQLIEACERAQKLYLKLPSISQVEDNSKGQVTHLAFMDNEQYFSFHYISTKDLYLLLDDFSISMLPFEPKHCLFTQILTYRDGILPPEDLNYHTFKANKSLQVGVAEHLGDRFFDGFCDLIGDCVCIEPGYGVWGKSGLLAGFVPSNFVGDTWKHPNKELVEKARRITKK